MATIGFIGTGNMGGALAEAAAKAGGHNLLLSNRTPEKAAALAEKIGAGVSDNISIAKTADYIFLGVKPQMMAGVLGGLSPVFNERAESGGRFVLITMAAGMTMDKISNLAGGSFPVIRIMPNLPVSMGEGVVLYTFNNLVNDADVSVFKSALLKAGLLSEIPEHLMDAGSAITGCGAAFVCLFIEALADGGVLSGLPRADAVKYAAQMTAGAAKLLLESGMHPGELKDAVCSPGGTTIEGVKVLEEGGFRASVIDAVEAAYKKNAAFK